MTTTTPVTVASLVADYRAADTKAKVVIRAAWKKSLHDELIAGHLDVAQTYMLATDAVRGPQPPSPRDYIGLFADRVLALRVAANMIERGEITPSGIDDDDVPDLSAVCLSRSVSGFVSAEVFTEATAIASMRFTRSDQHDIQDVVDRAFDGLAVGTFLSLASITERAAASYEAEGQPYTRYTGPISARLWPIDSKGHRVVTTLRGVTAVRKSADNPNGARKV